MMTLSNEIDVSISYVLKCVKYCLLCYCVEHIITDKNLKRMVSFKLVFFFPSLLYRRCYEKKVNISTTSNDSFVSLLSSESLKKFRLKIPSFNGDKMLRVSLSIVKIATQKTFESIVTSKRRNIIIIIQVMRNSRRIFPLYAVSKIVHFNAYPARLW